MRKFFIILCIFLGLYKFSFAQITISIPDTVCSQGTDTLKIPIEVTNFNNIGAISIKIKYDPSVISYDTAQTQIDHGTFISNSSNDTIYIGWFDINPLNIGNGTLLNLLFTGVKGNSSLQFITSDCDIANSDGTSLNVTYVNGSISELVLPVTLGGTVWLDSNNNGLIDSGEKGVQWVTVDLWSGSGRWLAWQITDAYGHFEFNNYRVISAAGDTSYVVLQPGQYYVDYILVGYNTNYKFVTEGVGSDPSINSHAILITDTTAKTDIIDLSSGEVYNYANAGLIWKSAASVGGDLSKKNTLPKKFGLQQNYPNPFNPTTTITYSIPKGSFVSLKIYNILGNEVAVLVNGYKSAGEYRVIFNMNNANKNLTSGIYLYRLTAGNKTFVKKMILVK